MKSILTILLITLYTSGMAQTYYIATAGNDANAGTSSASPRKTIPALVAGRAYLLNKGDTFYNKISRVNTTVSTPIFIGSYGTGVKPVHSMYIDLTGWVLDAGNIWKMDFTNPSNISGATTGTTTNIGFLKINNSTLTGKKKSTYGAMTSQWDFYSDATYIYVYSTTNPSSAATRIQGSGDRNSIDVSDNMTIDGVQFMGTGKNCVSAFQQSNLIVRNCDIKEYGGSYLSPGSSSTRFGNGIQLFNGAHNNLIEDNTIKQGYDVALTMQTANSTSLHTFSDVIFRRNICDSNEQSVELTLLADTGAVFVSNSVMLTDSSRFIRCSFTRNTFKNAGFGWGHTVRPSVRGIHLVSYQWKTRFTSDVVIENNTFYRAADGLYYAQVGTSIQPIPPYTSRNNDIWLDAATYIRMSATGTPNGSQYTWQTATYTGFVSNTGKEVGSTWGAPCP